MLEPIPFAGYMEIDEMNNEPVAWGMLDSEGGIYDTICPEEHDREEGAYSIPLYTQDQLEEARKLGMQQERALWNLSESTQEIMNTHPATTPMLVLDGNRVYPVIKELTDEEIVKLHEETSFFGVLDPVKFARAILRKASEK